MESKKKRVLDHIKNRIIDKKVVLFKLIDKKEWPMQNLRNRYIQTEQEYLSWGKFFIFCVILTFIFA